MIAKADKASLRIACGTTGIALLCLLPQPAGARDGPYLTWRSKTVPVQAADAPPPVRAPQVPVPPSPYGQVGDPYLHVLTWSNKTGTATWGGPVPRPAAPPQVATAAPVRRAPLQQVYAPPPAAPVQIHPAPAPDVAAQPPRPRPPVQAPQPQAQPQAQVQPAANDGAYQVPASSPYAARVAAARAAQARAVDRAQPQPQPQLQASALHPAQPPAPAPAPQTADDDKPFVPGEHYTDASEAPRLYSLHRAYGLKPDPITVDTNASGALLDTTDIDAAAAKAAKAEKADQDAAGDDSQADGAPAKSDTASASGTQNASDSKKNKAAQ